MSLQAMKSRLIDAHNAHAVTCAQWEVTVCYANQLERRTANEIPSSWRCLRVNAGLASRQSDTACFDAHARR